MKKNVQYLFEELQDAERRVKDLKDLLGCEAKYYFLSGWKGDDLDIDTGFCTRDEKKRLVAFLKQEKEIQDRLCKSIEKQISDCYK